VTTLFKFLIRVKTDLVLV